MAITPSQWSYVLTIPESYTPSAATSGQTLVITESVIAKLSASDQTTFWANVQNGGGDVRICENSEGTNQLPVEVVSLDNSAQTCVIWTRKPTYNGTGDLYVFIGKAGETQPPVTDPFGRNAVWSDLRRVFHFSDGGASTLIDSTGASDATLVGSSSIAASLSGWGSATKLNDSRYNGSLDPVENEGEMYFSGWINSSSESSSFGLAGAYDGNSNSSFLIFLSASDGFLKFRVPKNGVLFEVSTSSPVFNSGASLFVQCVYDGSSIKMYVNGVEEGSVARTGLIGSSSDGFVLGSIRDGSTNSANSVFQEFKFAAISFSQAYRDTEYANQSDPANFFGTPTLASTGGGVDITISLDSGAYSLSGTDANILKDSFLPTETGDYIKEGQSLELLSQRSLHLSAGSYTKGGDNIPLIIDRFLSTESGGYVYAGQDVDLSYRQSLTFTLDTGSYTYQGTDQGILKNFLLPVEAGEYTYDASNVTLLADRSLPLQSGEYTKTGNSINFVYETNGITYTLSLEEGRYLKQGTPLRMLADRLLPVDTGTYLYEGTNSNLLYNRVVALGSGLYSSAGTDLGLKVNRRLQLLNGNYSLTGTPITLSYTGEVLALLEGYRLSYKQDSVNGCHYKQDAVNDCFYKQDILSIRYK